MTTNIELSLPDFDLGSQAQIARADRRRIDYIQKVIDRDFDTNDLQLLLDVRVTAQWWNDSPLEVMSFKRYVSAVKAIVTKHGSVTDAAKSQHAAYSKKLSDTADYIKMSQPMWKW
jgi:hypothetical protein